jgi:hypothetical protein
MKTRKGYIQTAFKIYRFGNLKRVLESTMKKNGLPVDMKTFKFDDETQESFKVDCELKSFGGEKNILYGVVSKEEQVIDSEKTCWYVELHIN